MAIPDYQSLMLPLLRLIGDLEVHTLKEATETLGSRLCLTEDELAEMLPSGVQPVFRNRVGWAKAYMKQAGLLDIVKRGSFKITQAGVDLLATNPSSIDNSTLEQYTSFLEFKNRKKEKSEVPSEVDASHDNNQTPEEALDAAYQQLRNDIQEEMLTQLKSNSPYFFERAVIDLLLKMGYGGNRHDAAKAVGKSGDGGIDGIINEDRLGLDVIYIQAKRWEGTVGRPEVQKFAGALQGRRAKKGIFISTSFFTREARDYVQNIDTRIILIDGERLSQLMVDHNVGVFTAGSYDIKKIDSDYFDE